MPIAARCQAAGPEALIRREPEADLALFPLRRLGYVLGAIDAFERFAMFPKPKPALTPNTYAYESEPLVKPTGFREYDARWLLGTELNLMGAQALGLGLGTRPP